MPFGDIIGRMDSAAQQFKSMDEAKVSKLHWKIMLISGMGFFTDAYDLFIIGVVSSILKTAWHLNAFEVSLLSSTALLASAAGAIIFGRIADVLVYLVGAISVIMIIIGGLRYVLSNGDPKATGAAKDTILYAAIGVVVAIVAYAIVKFVVDNIK